ncbi:MAG: HD domain-containing protein [Sedimentisphaerales bacterium]|nr:HD domain-containing protein [Sedimentisphaerales bacterium]
MLNTVDNRLSFLQSKVLRDFGSDMNSFGINLVVYDSQLNLLFNFEGGRFTSDYESISAYARKVLVSGSNRMQTFGEFDQILSASLMVKDETLGVVVMDCGQPSLSSDNESRTAISGYINQIFKMFMISFEEIHKNQREIELVSNELAQTYEELVLLYKMSTNMKVTQSDSNYLQMACDSLTELINVEGIAIFLERQIDDMKQLVLTAGTGLIAIEHKQSNMHEILFERLLARLELGDEALLDSEVDSPLDYEWYGRIKSIIAVPLRGKDKIIGMMVATNRLDKPDFDSTSVKLFSSVANECAVFIENETLFRELKELFIGSLKALTNSIDAKDQYTRGHSERVAFISKWIAEHYSYNKGGLTVEDIQKIYLAGLLHDIGKIGVSEEVLRKEGELTNIEYEQMKIHPTLGAGILSEIRQMNDIIPGVLCHHEWYNGQGYPRGLAKDEIPLAGKIVMIADAFDAMTSKRTYRGALGLTNAIDEIEKSLGIQFDPEIGAIFINSDIRKLWEIIQGGSVENYSSSRFSDYGTVAVGALLR